MAEPLTAAQFALAFDFTRSETAGYRNPAGALVTAAIDAPAFDHDAGGVPLGLLVGEGEEIGGRDRVTIDPLILPEVLLSGTAPGDRDATVFHRFDPGTGEERRAVYSRNVRATIDALLFQLGHHREIGVTPGFRPNEGGFCRYRGEIWLLPELVEAGSGSGTGVFADTTDRPLIRAGAEEASE